MARLRARVLLMLFALAGATATADAAIITYNSATPANNATVRASWLAAIGIASPQYFEDFEAGFVNGQNVSGVPSLFPGGLIITDTSTANQAIVRSGDGVIGSSNPVGVFSLTHNESQYLVFDFSASPIDYFGFLDIDQASTNGTVFFVGGGSTNFSFETTGASGNTAEFFGLFRNDQPRIQSIRFDASGDGRWGVDNLEYGSAVVPEPASMLLFGTGLLVVGRAWRKSRR